MGVIYIKQITKVSLTHPLITLASESTVYSYVYLYEFCHECKIHKKNGLRKQVDPSPHTERILLLRGHYCLCLTYHCLVDSAIGLRIRMHRYLLISFQWEGESACNLSWDVRHRARSKPLCGLGATW